MPNKRASIDEIQNAINDFVSELPKLERQKFNRIYSILKDLSLDAEGKIKPTVQNLKIINRVKSELYTITDNPEYQSKVEDLEQTIGSISKVQTAYYAKTFSDFTKPKSIEELEKITWNNTVDSLTEAGINENVINDASDIVEQHIRDGSSMTTLVDDLKARIVSSEEVDSKLVSYSKQIINDTLTGFSRNYHSIVTSDLGLEWFEYLGALMDTSRPFCEAMVEKHYVHVSELSKCAHGNIDGKKVSLQGLMPGTNGDNLQNRCGGYNCNHQLIPVPSSTVPTSLRRKFEKDVKPDDEELSSERPRRK